MRGYNLENGMIVLDRELSELDVFVRDFLEVLKRHSDYLIVSGFVSICSGRARGTEDVDVIVSLMDEKKFKELFDELLKENFWCYQGDVAEEVYGYLRGFVSVRFARVGEMFPNMEVVPFDESKRAKVFEFGHPQSIRVRDFEFKIPMLEFEILYKERVLGSGKDIADARHLRTFFSEILDEDKFKECEEVIKLEIGNESAD